MHEWLEALRKSVKASSVGVPPEEIRRAETECGVPFPDELSSLYQAFNGGELNGKVRLFPLHGEVGYPSVLEKTRLKLEGLPAAGLWRIGLKGQHRHLFASRKSAMVEQGDGGGPLPGWVEALEGDDWVYGTWEGEKRQMRLYRTLRDMLDVLVPPAEVESFGERTFARAMNAVLQGALSGVQADEEAQEEEAAQAEEAQAKEEALEAEVEGEEAQAEEEERLEEAEVRELEYEYDEFSSASRGHDEGRKGARASRPGKARPAQAEQIPLAIGGAGVLFPRGAPRKAPTVAVEVEPAPEKKRLSKKPPASKAPEREPAAAEPVVAEAAPQGPAASGARARKSEAREATAKKAPARKSVVKVEAEEAPVLKKGGVEKPAAAKTASVRTAVGKKPTAEKSAKAGAATKATEKKATAKTGGATKPAAQKSTKAGAAKKAMAKAGGAAKKSIKAGAAKKATAKPGAAKKSAARKTTAKVGGVKKPVAKKSAAKAGATKKSAAKKAASRGGAKKGARRR